MAAATIFPEGRVTTWSSIVNPEQPIPPESTAIHGISDAMAANAPTFLQLAPTITGILSGCDLTGYNIKKFDCPMLTAEFRRVGLEDPTVGARIIDAYTILVRQESRSLDAALRFYGIEDAQGTRRAHEAASDVEAAVAVLAAQMKAYPDVPRTVDALHDWLFPTDPNRIDADSKLVWQGEVAVIAFGQQQGMSLVDLATSDRGFLEWILRKDFSEQVKAIVRDALAGRFPVRGEQPPAWSNSIRLT
jgi:DNA polymerase-3 subunit epsilon